MLQIDSRRGSGELTKYFHAYGISPQVTTLEFGDFAWTGEGPEGKSLIAVERKRINDLIDSMKSKRLSGHQLGGIAETYDFAYLLVEGIWRPGDRGELEINSGGWQPSRMKYSSVINYLATLRHRANISHYRTASQTETAAVIVALYKYWQTPWYEHKAHEQIYTPVNEAAGWEYGKLVLTRREISLCEMMACQIPGLAEKARYVAGHFGTPRAMICADAAEWAKVVWYDGKQRPRKFQKKTIAAIMAALEGKEGG